MGNTFVISLMVTCSISIIGARLQKVLNFNYKWKVNTQQ